MKTALKIATVLSWINLAIGGYSTIALLYGGLEFRSLSLLIVGFLLSSIILHSYAALKLRRSILRTDKPLNPQTPTGIRFIGAAALFFGMLFFASGIAILQSPSDFMKLLQSEFGKDPALTLSNIRIKGLCSLVGGLSISLNVMLNFRLLRWYYLMKGMM